MIVSRRHFTLSDFLHLEPPDEIRYVYELIEGELVVHASPSDGHALAAMAFTLFLGDAQRAGYGRVVAPRRYVALDYAQHGMAARDVVEPDVFFVLNEHAGILEGPAVLGVPDIVVEIESPSTRADDRPDGAKLAAYERAGLRYYWLADPEARRVTQYEHRAGLLVESAVFGPGDVLRCPLFPALNVLLTAIFP